MKKICYLFVFSLCLILAACGGSKNVAAPSGDVDVDRPCRGPEFMTSGEYYRASAAAISSDMTMAEKKAMTEARAALASAIQTHVDRVIQTYASSHNVGEDTEDVGRYKEMGIQVTRQKLSGIRVICDKMKKTPEGKYRSYIAIELAGNEIQKEMNNRISKDEKLKIDFEAEKFKKIFDEELKKYAEENR